jgi:hypothetical protein
LTYRQERSILGANLDRKDTMRRPSPAFILALIALFVALGGAGMAATGGNFILGQANSATSTTSLSAPIGGKALQLSNTSTNAGATPLGLTAALGHAPFTVNTSTKVANLNADTLDGKDSTYFLPKTGKAANSDKLDGIDSTGFVRAAVPATGALVGESWHEVSSFNYCKGLSPLCAGGWAYFGSPYNTPAYYKDPLGIVHLKGLVQWTASFNLGIGCDFSSFFQLPAGYRPAANVIAPTLKNDALGRVDVDADGWVTLCTSSEVTNGDWYLLDGINFRAAG